jgi:hypothetical protein
MTYKNTTLNRHNFSTKFILVALVAAIVVPLLTILVPRAHAATLTNSYIRLDRLATSTSNDNTLVVFTVPAGNATTEDEVDVTFPSSTYITVGASPTVTITGCAADSGGTALPGTLAAAKSGQIVQVTGVTNLAASTKYCFYINAGVSTTSTAIPTTPTSAGQAFIDTKASSAPVDSTTVGMTTIANDQVVVTAAVAPYFTFTLSANSAALGTLSQTAKTDTASPVDITLKTNAPNGWLAWAKSGGKLHSTAATHDINSASTTITPGTENYGLLVTKTISGTAGVGTGSIPAEYDFTPGSDTTHVGILTTSYKLIGSTTGGGTDNDVLHLTFRAMIGALTPAASDYQDTVTLTGAGNF